MANGRPPADDSRRPSRRSRAKGANEGGLEALGKQLGGGASTGSVANESGLKALGARIDQKGGRGRGSGRGGQPGRSGSRWSRRRKVVTSLVSLFVLIVLVVGAVYGYARYQFDQLTKQHYAAEVEAQAGGPFTMLVIGSDSRVGESSQASKQFGSAAAVTGQRSDVVQLWRVTPSTKQIQILSIPRDTVVAMVGQDVSENGTYNRINSSFNLGANQLIKTIQANFGIAINYTVQIGFAGFQDAVNALGGVYLDFNYPAKDAYSGLNITTPGCQLLDGSQALAVARSRHYQYYQDGEWQYDPTSDYGRIERQDAFIRALISRAKSTVNPLKINSFISSIHEGLVIDDRFGLNQLIGLALTYRSFNPDALAAQTLPTEPSTAFPGLGDVLVAEQPAAQQTLVDMFGSSLTAPTSPPPDVNGYPEAPPNVTPTTAAPSPKTGTTTPTTTPTASYNPTPCTPK
jgi:LCP family protein required for cell wall assembly